MAAASLARYARWPTESASVGSAVSTVLCLCLFVCGFSHGNSTADHANAAKLQKDHVMHVMHDHVMHVEHRTLL